ncbi:MULTISPECIES: hypothetical protein [Agrobacterium]|uniref:hypothetical protein n=1 Tax=Agrobacterium TaxID=357 RepID=UPI0011EFA3A3|nr:MULTISPECIES: hypothetical protein [Agrobacterium]MCZ7866262.1 hypothetical protein [Agrobacterium salinitolerans]MDA5641451.1 hypothetical protein [Agrobacterium sp. ST15.13.013]MDA7001676.1 hypothetical protein [Agrobacterium salinitolerans]TZG32924.1 hypothetical protein AGR1_20450 [Agrobacterium sp. B1(2019)]
MLLALSLLSSCGDSWSWHQKLTVTVETPSGPKSASSVMKASLDDRDGLFALPEARGAFFELRGEAVVLEVLPGKYLFALLKDMPRPYALFFPGIAPVDIAPKFERMSKPATATLSKADYPLLVTFTDFNDPKTVKRVNPDNLAEFFGSGTSLISITLSITREQVTEGKIEDVLGWLKEEGEKNPTLLPNPPYLRKDATDPDMQYLKVSSFSTELYK